MHRTVHEVRTELSRLYNKGEFVIDKSGVKTVEIMNASFIANQPLIFGAVNEEYVQRELDWYLSESLNVNDIPLYSVINSNLNKKNEIIKTIDSFKDPSTFQ